MQRCTWTPTSRKAIAFPAKLRFRRNAYLLGAPLQRIPVPFSHLCQCSQREVQVSSVVEEAAVEKVSQVSQNDRGDSTTSNVVLETSQSSSVTTDQQQQGHAPMFQKLATTAVLVSPFFFWGTSMVAMKAVLPHATPLLISTLRLLPAGVVLVAWAAASGRPQPQTPIAWAWITAFALVDAAAFQGFLAEGLQRTSAGLGSVIIDSQPLSVAVMAAVLFGEQLKPAGIAGLFIGVAGLLMLELPPEDLDFVTLPLQALLHLSPSLTDAVASPSLTDAVASLSPTDAVASLSLTDSVVSLSLTDTVAHSAMAVSTAIDASIINTAIGVLLSTSSSIDASTITAAMSSVPNTSSSIDASTITAAMTVVSSTSSSIDASSISSISSINPAMGVVPNSASSLPPNPAASLVPNSASSDTWSLWDSGEWWMLLAAQAMAVGTVMVRGVAKHADPFIATGWHMILGGVMLLGFIAATDAPSIGGSLAQFQTEDVLAMAYVSLLGGAVSYGVFFDNATRGNLTALSSLTFLTPMFAAGAGFLLLNETLTPLQLTGAGVTLSAVYLINK